MSAVKPHIAESITRITEETVPGCFIVELLLPVDGRHSLTLLVDTDAGISIDECARIARAVGRWLDEESGIEHSYELEVSSPGLTRPLRVQRQYIKNVGRKLKVIAQDGTVFTGVLESANDEGITLGPGPKKKVNPKNLDKEEKGPSRVTQETFIAYSDIREAKVKISMTN